LRRYAAVTGVTVVTAAVFMLPGLLAGPALDPAAFLLDGKLMAGGVVPYLGFWDHKMPGIFAINAIAPWLLSGVSPWDAIWALSVAAAALTGLAAYDIAARAGLGRASWFAAVGTTAGLSIYAVSGGGGMSELFAVLPAAWALAIAFRRPSGPVALAALGFLTACSVLISLQLLSAAVAVAFVILRGGISRRGRSILIGIGAFLLPLAGVSAVLVIGGSAPDFVDQILRYSGPYRAALFRSGNVFLVASIATAVLTLIGLVGPAFESFIAWRRHSPGEKDLVTGSAVWIAAGIALIVVQGRFYPHYGASLIPALGVLGAVGSRDLWRLASQGPAPRSVVIGLGACLAIITVAIGVLRPLELIAGQARLTERTQAVARLVRNSSKPSDTIFVWANNPYLYLLADRRPASRYIYLLPLMTPGYSTPAMVDALVREFSADPPRLIIDAGSPQPGEPGDLALLIPRPLKVDDGRDLDLLDPLREFVRQRYRLLGTSTGWPIYVLVN